MATERVLGQLRPRGPATSSPASFSLRHRLTANPPDDHDDLIGRAPDLNVKVNMRNESDGAFVGVGSAQTACKAMGSRHSAVVAPGVATTGACGGHLPHHPTWFERRVA
jgi:hypothetical protein